MFPILYYFNGLGILNLKKKYEIFLNMQRNLFKQKIILLKLKTNYAILLSKIL